MKNLYEPQGSRLPIPEGFRRDLKSIKISTSQRGFFLLWCILLTSTASFSQVLNVTQAAVVESGYGKAPNLTGASKVFVKGNYAYVVGTGDVLEILDITLPGLPIHKGSLANGEGGASILRAQAIVVSGNYAYITSYGANALEIVDVSDPSKPVHKGIIYDGGGSAPYLNTPWGLHVEGNYAYVTSTVSNALEIIDVSNPALPVHKGSILDGGGSAPFLNGPVSVTVSGNYAYVGSIGADGISGALEIINISNPALPFHKGSLLNGGGTAPYLATCYDVFLSGSYAYITDFYNKALEIVDVSNPAAPVHTGSIIDGNGDIPYLSKPFSVFVSGNYAYVGNYSVFRDIEILNVVDNYNSAFEIIDISNPATPVHAAALKDRFPDRTYIHEIPSIFYQCRSVFVVGNKAYLTGRYANSLTTVDITNPLSPEILNATTNGPGGALLDDPRAIVVKDNYAYVASYGVNGGLEVLDVTNPARPLHAGSLPGNQPDPFSLMDPVALCVEGNYVYVANRVGSVTIVDISSPTAPVVEEGYTFPLNLGDRLTSIAVSNDGRFVHVAKSSKRENGSVISGGIDEIAIIGIDNPEDPYFNAIDNIVSGPAGRVFPNPSSIYIGADDHTYITSADGNSLEILDFYNAHAGNIAHGDGGALLQTPSCVFVSGKYAYVTSTGSDALEIIDISNPTFPVHKGSITNGTGGAFMPDPISVYVSGKYAYVASPGDPNANGGLEIIDVSDPANPTHYQSFVYPTGGALIDRPTSVSVSGNYAYITNAGLFQAVDIVYLYGPNLANVSPLKGAVGTSVTITGQNFNTFLTASINAVDANITNITENTLTLTVPEGATIGKINLHYSGQIFTSVENFIVTPTARAASNTQQTSFTANWSDVGATGYFLDVSKDNFATFEGAFNNYALGKITQLEVTGLTSGISYQYRVRSTDGTATSDNSNVTSVLTIPATPTTSVTAISQTGFNVNWNTATGATGYFLDVAVETKTFAKFLTGLNNLSTTSTSHEISGVTPGLTYYYRVRSSNATGTSSSSVLDSVTTIPASPVARAATLITSSGFLADWLPVAGADKYFLDVSTDDFNTFVSGYENKEVSVTAFPMVGLSSGTYYYRVRAGNISGTSPNSATITVATVPEGQPTDILFSNASATSITVSFNAAIGNPTGYLVVRSAVSPTPAAPVNGVSYTAGASLDNVTIASVGPLISFNDDGLPTATKYYYHVYSYNGSGSSIIYLATDPLQGSVTLDVTPPSINNSSNLNPTTISAGNTPTFSAVITDNVGVASAKIFYRGVSRQEFNMTELTPSGVGGNYSIQIQTTWYDSIGLEYYFWAKDENGNETSKPVVTNFAQLVSPSLSLPGLPSGTSQSNYRIVSFPYQLPVDNKVTTVYNGVPWNDDTKAALFRWDPELKNGAGDYEKYGAGSNLQTVDIGNGYWILVSSDFAPQLTNVAAPKYNRSNLYTMTLKPRWNEIGNPYPVPISWDDVVAFNQNVNPSAQFSPLSIFDGTGYKEATLLKAFEGGFVKNLGSSDINIIIPFPGQTTPGGRKSTIGTDISSDSWKSFLNIQQKEFNNDLGGFGMHPQSISGEDRHDNFNPPRFLDIPEINFSTPDAPGILFSTNMVNTQAHHVWQFTTVGKKGEVTTLTWSPDLSSEEEELYLLDEEQMKIVNMMETYQYSFILNDKSRFRLFYGKNVYNTITTEDIRVGSAYPNPLTSQALAIIPIGLPDRGEEYHVTLQLFNAQGNPLETVVYKMPPGLNTLAVNLEEAHHASGLYVYRVSIRSSKTSGVYTGKIVKP